MDIPNEAYHKTMIGMRSSQHELGQSILEFTSKWTHSKVLNKGPSEKTNI